MPAAPEQAKGMPFRVSPRSAGARSLMTGSEITKHEHVVRVDADALPGVRFNHPRELHDRAAGRCQDRALDVVRLPLDPEAFASGERDLSERQDRLPVSAPWSRVSRTTWTALRGSCRAGAGIGHSGGAGEVARAAASRC